MHEVGVREMVREDVRKTMALTSDGFDEDEGVGLIRRRGKEKDGV